MQTNEQKNDEIDYIYEMAVKSEPQSYINITLTNGTKIETTAYDPPEDFLGIWRYSKKWLMFLTGDEGCATVRKKDISAIEATPYTK